jgi:hypothetical protein
MTFSKRILSVLAGLLVAGSMALGSSDAAKASPAPAASGSQPLAALPAAPSVCPKADFLTLLPAPQPAAIGICGACSDADCLGKELGSPCGLEDMRCSIASPACATGVRCQCRVI